MSGLLNALDGAASPEGGVLIMTTNHIELLDGALVQPSRVDKKIQFGLAGDDMLVELFCNIFKPLGDETEDDGTHAKDRNSVEMMATTFAGNLPEGVFSPAEVLSFLLEHRHSPRGNDNVQEWASRDER